MRKVLHIIALSMVFGGLTTSVGFAQQDDSLYQIKGVVKAKEAMIIVHPKAMFDPGSVKKGKGLRDRDLFPARAGLNLTFNELLGRNAPILSVVGDGHLKDLKNLSVWEKEYIQYVPNILRSTQIIQDNSGHVRYLLDVDDLYVGGGLFNWCLSNGLYGAWVTSLKNTNREKLNVHIIMDGIYRDVEGRGVPGGAQRWGSLFGGAEWDLSQSLNDENYQTESLWDAYVRLGYTNFVEQVLYDQHNGMPRKVGSGSPLFPQGYNESYFSANIFLFRRDKPIYHYTGQNEQKGYPHKTVNFYLYPKSLRNVATFIHSYVDSAGEYLERAYKNYLEQERLRKELWAIQSQYDKEVDVIRQAVYDKLRREAEAKAKAEAEAKAAQRLANPQATPGAPQQLGQQNTLPPLRPYIPYVQVEIPKELKDRYEPRIKGYHEAINRISPVIHLSDTEKKQYDQYLAHLDKILSKMTKLEHGHADLNDLALDALSAPMQNQQVHNSMKYRLNPFRDIDVYLELFSWSLPH